MVASAALAGCVSAPEPEPSDPTLQIPAGSDTPAIPDPVPVTVVPLLSPSAGAEEELAAVVPLHTLPEHVLAEPPLVQQDLLDRMRAGMSLPPVKNSRPPGGSSAATLSRAISTATDAARPLRYWLDGLA